VRTIISNFIALVLDLSRIIIVSLAGLVTYLVIISSGINSSDYDVFGQELHQQPSDLSVVKDESLQVEKLTDGLILPTSVAFIDSNGTLLVSQNNNGQVVVISNNRSILDQPATPGSSSSDNPLSLLSLSSNEGGSPVLGSLEAPITVVDFSDFQCPKCARFVKSTEPEIKKEYIDTGKVAFVFKHFPRLGDDSYSAALASECAKEQGKFWEYHDTLFHNQQAENSGWANKEKLKEFASDIGLDRQQFDSCLDEEKYKPTVERDLAMVKELDFHTTPSFLIIKSDGTEMEVLTGAHPFPSFKALIDKKIS
jgi:protein-disulfide isomerase